MRITLAYPFTLDGETYPADSTIELPREIAAPLLAAGRARRPDPDPIPQPAATRRRINGRTRGA